MNLSRILRLCGMTAAVLLLGFVFMAGNAHAYSNSHLMDDAIFDNVHSMSEQQIRDFINSRPTSCLATSGAIFPEPITYWKYGGNVDAARVIYQAAVYNDLNPEVILAMLQKEQSLITRTTCFDGTIDVRNKALSMGCPDGGACPAPAYAGFHQQVMKGAWTLKFSKERANGNVGWGDNGSIVYGGPWTEGNRQACTTCTQVYHDGYWTIDGQLIKMETGATAALYRYTPHLGQSFPGIFEGWFGSALVPTYGWSISGQSSSKSLYNLLPSDTVSVTVKAVNTGNTTWVNDGLNPVRIGATAPLNRNSSFAAPGWISPARPATLTEASVAPGETGTFTFNLKIPYTAGHYHEYFSLLREGVTWFNDPGMNFDITVQPAKFTWSLVGQGAYADSSKSTPINLGAMSPGQTSWLTLTVQNTGNMTWTNAAENRVLMGTEQPRDRTSRFQAGGWPGANRPAVMHEASVAPGTNATFEFPIAVPAGAGQFFERFNLLADGITWMNDLGLSYYIKVNQQYAWSVTAQYAYTDSSKSTPVNLASMTPGKTAFVGFKAQNTGTSAWLNTGAYPIDIATARATDRLSAFAGPGWFGANRPARLVEARVDPGQTGTFEFTYVAPATKGTYLEYFRPVAEDIAHFPDLGLNFYTVVR